MMRFLLPLLPLLFIAATRPSPSRAIDLPLDCRVSNVGNFCTWCSIASLARFHRLDRLRSIAHDRYIARNGATDPGYMPVVRRALDARKVHYLAEDDGTYNRATLARYAATHGVVVTLIAGNNHSIGCHSVVLTKYTDDEIEFWDSSKPLDKETKQPKTWKVARSWFDRYWSGNSIVVLPDDTKIPTNDVVARSSQER